MHAEHEHIDTHGQSSERALRNAPTITHAPRTRRLRSSLLFNYRVCICKNNNERTLETGGGAKSATLVKVMPFGSPTSSSSMIIILRGNLQAIYHTSCLTDYFTQNPGPHPKMAPLLFDSRRISTPHVDKRTTERPADQSGAPAVDFVPEEISRNSQIAVRRIEARGRNRCEEAKTKNKCGRRNTCQSTRGAHAYEKPCNAYSPTT